MLQDRSSQLHIPSVVKTLLLARVLRVPRFIYAPGLGPVLNKFGKYLSKLALKGANILIVRDKESVDFLNSIGINENIKLTADPAFDLQTPFDNLKRHLVKGAIADGWMHCEIEIEFTSVGRDEVKAKIKFYSQFDHSLVRIIEVAPSIKAGDTLRLPGLIVSYKIDIFGSG